MNRGALLATVSGVAKNWTLLSDKAHTYMRKLRLGELDNTEGHLASLW